MKIRNTTEGVHMIRKFKLDDLEAVMKIWLDTNIETHDFINQCYWQGNYEMVREMLPDSTLFVYETNDTIQGFIGLMGNYVAGIFINKNYQSKGIGKELLDYVKEKYTELDLQVYKKNTRAVKFYLREEFVVSKEQMDDGTGEVELVLKWTRRGVFVLPITFHLDKTDLIIYPTLLKDENELILIDCGYPDSLPQIEHEMNKIGLSLSQLTKIIITHHDHDHMGALREIKERYPAVEILCSKEEAPYITGQRNSLRLQQAESIQDSLPESEKEGGKQFQDFIASIKKVDSVTVINIGDILPFCGGMKVVDTKGHMPGHISFYMEKERILIAGDALVVENEQLCMAMPQFVLNMQDAQDSIRNLLSYDINKIICYHGGIYDSDVKESIKELVEKF
jgi:glyoxylase-like metal-dependent hydrolase (beta-lactamase superfamily II)/ribosomal protein S18 acetylase RimI-like enzyme